MTVWQDFFKKSIQTFFKQNYFKKFHMIHFLKMDLYFPSIFREIATFKELNFRKDYPWQSYFCQFKNWFLEFKIDWVPHSKTKYKKKCIPYFVTNFSAVAETLFIMVKQNVILRLVHPNIWESLYVQVEILSQPKILLCRVIC